MKTTLPQFVTSYECRSGAHCGRCRDSSGGEKFRANLSERFTLPQGRMDFRCPHGKPWGYVPPVGMVAAASPPLKGPGTELNRILASLGYEATAACSCNAYARQMDAWGVDGCWERFDEILDWLAAEAARRGEGFYRPAAGFVVWLAVVNAWVKG